MAERLLDAIATAAARVRDEHNPEARTAAVALLWPDRARQWEPVIDRLRGQLPIVTLGGFDPETMHGPAYWVRCVVAGELGDLKETPIIYLPGVGREDLRAVEQCPAELAPIAELQFRGEWFSHRNGRDWTVRTFLAHEEGLNLAVPDDRDTATMLTVALPRLLDEPMRRLQRQAVIDAEALRELVNPDPVGDLLRWLDDPTAFRQSLDDGQWQAFVGNCHNEFDFDPERDGQIEGGRRLGMVEGKWERAWRRYREAPEILPGVEERLRQAKPNEQLLEQTTGAWPQDNDEAEAELRDALRKLADATPGAAREELSRLWDRHKPRQAWVWAELGKSPLAFALEQLVRVAEMTRHRIDTTSVESARKDFAEQGWRVDDAAVRALAATEGADRAAVAMALEAVYRPWLDQAARGLQEAIGPAVHSNDYVPQPAAAVEQGIVTLFVDGLRLDVAHRLMSRLDDLQVEQEVRPAALPTVTATSKPTLVPAEDGTLAPGPELAPARASSGAIAGQQVLVSLMRDKGVEFLPPDSTGDPSGAGWTEAGEIDSTGHKRGSELVEDLDREVERIARRVRELLDAGWTRIDVVTDHGFLLLPSGLPKFELPVATVVTRKGRCARITEGATVDVPVVPWTWDAHVRIAVAPGVGCFEAGKQYEHGGISPQECFVPHLSVTAGTRTDRVTGGPRVTAVSWRGLICRIEFEHVAPGATVDIRRQPGDPTSSVAVDTKETRASGKASLFAQEEAEGQQAYVVLVDPDGQVLAQKQVAIGQNR